MKVEILLNVLKNLPSSALSELVVVSRSGKVIRGRIEFIVNYDSNPYDIGRAIELIGGSFEDLGYNFGIVTVSIENIEKISNIKGIQHIEIPRTLYSNHVNFKYERDNNTILGFIVSDIDYNQKVADDNSIIMIKATPGKNINHTKSSMIMKSIKYLIDKKMELGKNLIIYSNFHEKYYNDQHNLFYEYINAITKEEGIKFIFEKDRNADKIFLKKGKIRSFNTISVSVKKKKRGITLQLHKEFLNNYILEIVNPFGNSSGLIELSHGYNNGTVGEDTYHIYNTGPKAYNINGEVVINIVSNKDEIHRGEWKLNIMCEDEYKGSYALYHVESS